jgi:hypothetical protein
MLNLQVAMLLKTASFIILLLLFPSQLFQSVSPEPPRVDVPLPGDVVRGVVGITGSTDVEGFDYSEVFFGFSPGGAWFTLGRQNNPVNNQIITNWDTTGIPDGTYRLRVVVSKSDGSQTETVVDGIRVSNYSSAGTTSDAQTSNQSTEVADYDPSLKRTATPFPLNPAAVSSQDLISSLRAGILGTGALFLILGLYLGLRWFNKRK